jgi:hypothetical protein
LTVADALGQEVTTALEATTMRRLAFTRYLYTLGLEQLAKPEPLSSAAILAFHDAAELFLQLAAEHVDADTHSGISFMQYWAVLQPKIEGGVTQKEAMRRLNSARRGLKHAGTTLTARELESFRVAAERFFHENTPRLFGIEFTSVSLVDLVWNAEVRAKLGDAQQAVEQGDVPGSLAASAVAFEILVRDYELRKQGEFGRSPFFFGDDMTFLSSFHMGLSRGDPRSGPTDRRLGEFVDKVKSSLDAIREAVKLLSFGLDYRRYVRFRMLTPRVFRTMGGPEYQTTDLPSGTRAPTATDAEFCIDFVIESALRLQEFDFSIDSVR